jgi:hypothetical protein
MDVKKQVKEKFILELTRKEAEWLRALMQNPIPTIDNLKCNPDKEDKDFREMRRTFLIALSNLLADDWHLR